MRVANTLDEDASIHWHGILLPANMDGVPGLSFHGIRPGETYVYRFEVRQAGTYWYHSHSGFQEQRGLYGPLVIEPREPSPITYDREHVVMLTDWTDENPARVFAKLKKRSDYYNFHQRTVGDFLRDVRTQGLKEALADRKMWGEMRMNPTDLADVSGYTYTYLMNGTAPAGNWTGLFKSGERVRLRFINGSAMTTFDVRIPGLDLRIVQALAEIDAVDNARFLVPRSEIARELLVEQLRAAGGQVEEVAAYTTVGGGEGSAQGIYRMLLEREIDAVTFTSASTVRHFVMSSHHPSCSSYTGRAWWKAVCVMGISSTRSPSTSYPTQIGTFSRPERTSNLVTTRSVRPLTRTAWRATTASNQPQRRSRPVVVPYSTPTLRRCSPIASRSSVGNGPEPTRVV